MAGWFPLNPLMIFAPPFRAGMRIGRRRHMLFSAEWMARKVSRAEEDGRRPASDVGQRRGSTDS